MVSPLTEVTHANICNIDFEPPYQCSYKFSRFGFQSHFLVDVGSYVYKLDNFSHEDPHTKRKLVTLFEYLSFVDDMASSRAVPRKQKKSFIKTHLLVETSKKENKYVSCHNFVCVF